MRQLRNVLWTAAATALVGAAPVAAADATNPDWPCIQKKVENISVAQVWDGPDVDTSQGWQDNAAVKDLLPLLTSRRIPVEQAEAAIKKYADSLGADQRNAGLTLLFAGLFDTLNTQRRTVVNGMSRYLRAQKDRAAAVEQLGTELADLQAKPGKDEEAEKKIDEMQQKYDWESRIFQERQSNIPIACEIPGLIEERLYALARAIRANMKP